MGTYFLGQYRVVDEIGVGRVGSVHLARQDGSGGFQKWVVIKRIHPHLVEDDNIVDRFLDEMRIAARIRHPNVSEVFTVGKDDNTYWMVMEYIHGETLHGVMRRMAEQRLPAMPELAARICSDAADGLHAAHELRESTTGQHLGLVHRDVCPSNIMVTYDGYTKIIDFGRAKVTNGLSTRRAGLPSGRLAYMSPEQASGAEDIDRTTDIFALGVILWELTTRRRLFWAGAPFETFDKVLECEVPHPSTIVPGYPIEIEKIVLKALARDRRNRFQTAEDFSSALNDFLMHRGVRLRSREVGDLMRVLYADRLKERDNHLRWAGEVTSTINVDELRSRSLQAHEDVPTTGGISRRTSVSLMDEDEDIPTTGESSREKPVQHDQMDAIEPTNSFPFRR